MAEQAAFQVLAKGCFDVEWNVGGEIVPLFIVGQERFEVLSGDFME